MIKSVTLGLAIMASLVSISAVAVASTGSVSGSTVQTQPSATPKTTAASAESAKAQGGVQVATNFCRRRLCP